MADYIFLMHDDADDDENAWEPYLGRLKQKGVLQGGSAIGGGVCARKDGMPVPVTAHLSGYIRVTANNLDEAKSLLVGNPHSKAAEPSRSANCRERIEETAGRARALRGACLGFLDRLPDVERRHRHIDVSDAVDRERVDHGAHHHRRSR